MAALGPYFGDSMTVSAELEGGTTVPIGMTQSLEMSVETTETEYFSADSTLREAVQHSEKVPVVTFEIGEWDVELHKQWLGGSGTSSTGLVDTSDPQKFTITGEVSPVGATSAFEVEITGVTIPTLPFFSASRNEFIGNEFEGRGDDLTITTEPA